MEMNYSLHIIELQRLAARKNLTKESVIEQFTQLVNGVDTTTLEYISLHLTLLQSFMPGTVNQSDPNI